MKNQTKKWIPGISLILPFGAFMLFILLASMNEAKEDENPEYAAENEKTCLKCHGNAIYEFYNEWIEGPEQRIMNPYYRINREDYYRSVHASFSCTDCHSPDYEIFPHDGFLRMEPAYTCLDCHEGDENTAHYRFEQIAEEHEKSVHFESFGESFNCWKCHDPHNTKFFARNNNNILKVVEHANETCRRCHSNNDRYLLFSKDKHAPLQEVHQWLPNYELHMKKVRCIECHVEVQDSLLVGHHIRPKEKAVKNCVECHSTNSLLMASLYKFRSMEGRSEKGFFNSVILNESYVIGANRNYYLNLISLVIFGLTLAVIAVHIYFRIKTK